jgi:hypothetical protein
MRQESHFASRRWDGFRIRTNFLSKVILYQTDSLKVSMSHRPWHRTGNSLAAPQPKIDFARSWRYEDIVLSCQQDTPKVLSFTGSQHAVGKQQLSEN